MERNLFCRQNLLHPDAVRAIHESYLAAGSRAITTNTLTDNRIFLESHGQASTWRRSTGPVRHSRGQRLQPAPGEPMCWAT